MIFNKKEIITRKNIISNELQLTDVSSVFNPGATRINEQFILLLRVQNRARETMLVKAESYDGENFYVKEKPVEFVDLEQFSAKFKNEVEIFHIYDARITVIENDIFVICAVDTNQGCYLALFYTFDFEKLYFLNILGKPNSRNGVLFPEKINNYYYLLYRPNETVLENGTKTGSSISIARSLDLDTWEERGTLFSGRPHYWDELIGSGTVPVKTKCGWLHIYHGVATHFASSNIYQAGFVMLDLENPEKVIFRSKYNILEPRELYECVGQVPNVVFPTGLIPINYDDDDFVIPESDLFLFYGAADTSVCLAKTKLQTFFDQIVLESK